MEINLNGEKLKVVPSYKYLGFVMDPILGYNKHIPSVLRLIQHKLSVLGKVKRYMNKSTALKVYKTIVIMLEFRLRLLD